MNERFCARGALKAVVLLLVPLVGLMACDDPQPIKIGFASTFAGRAADLSKEGRDGALLAVEEVNNSGGIDGREIELLVRNDENNRATALRVDKELIDEGVVAIIGHMTSSMSVIAAPLMTREKVVMVSPTTSSNDLTGINDYFLRVYAASHDAATELAQYARRDLNLSRVSIVYDLSNRAHTKSWALAFGDEFTALGGTIPLHRVFSSSVVPRLHDVAADLVANDADGIMVLAGSLDTGLLCQHLQRKGFDGAVLVSQWSITRDIFRHGGDAVNGIRFFDAFDTDHQGERYLAFKKAFESRFKYPSGFAGAYAYEAAQVILEGIRRAQGSADLRETILSIGEFEGLQAKFEMDRFGDVKRQRILKTIKNGQFISLKRNQ
ncbi:MAG: ABC transporter substrate-binding protein [Alphaproteobacteria bacterium]|nr:ABC transporter substrate-binding protein [Alphaproteobacteria bacterium]